MMSNENNHILNNPNNQETPKSIPNKTKDDSRMEIGKIGKRMKNEKIHSDVPASNQIGIDRGRWAD